MANFHKHPGLERISHQTIEVNGDSVIIGLWGYKDFNGKDLSVTNEGDDLNIQPAGVAGQSTLWKISVKHSSRTHLSSVKDRVVAITDKWETWDWVELKFNFKTADAAVLEARPITFDLFGGPKDNIWRRSSVPAISLVTNGNLVPGQTAPRLQFGATSPSKPVDFAVFAAKHGAVERAFVLVLLTTGGPRPGFIYLPDPPCWSADPRYAQRKSELGGEYPHTWAIPHYTLYMALKSR